jgi:hypothetical protein
MSNVFDRIASGNGDRPEQQELKAPLTDARPAETAHHTGLEVKEVTQELLKHGYVEESANPALFQRAMVHEREILRVLEPLDLAVRLDTHRGVAFLVVAEAAFHSSEEGQA